MTIYRKTYNNYSVIVEGLQTIMRKHGHKDSYEKFKDLTRTNSVITKDTVDSFINCLDVSHECREEMKQITLENYIGNSKREHGYNKLFYLKIFLLNNILSK